MATEFFLLLFVILKYMDTSMSLSFMHDRGAKLLGTRLIKLAKLEMR
jgi:hypothetical protein